MAQLTRELFESGVRFSYRGIGTYKAERSKIVDNYFIDYNAEYHCSISDITDKGFSFFVYIMSIKSKGFVKFSECTVLE